MHQVQLVLRNVERLLDVSLVELLLNHRDVSVCAGSSGFTMVANDWKGTLSGAAWFDANETWFCGW